MKRMILAVVVMLAVSTLAGEFIGFVGVEQWQPGIVGLVGAVLGGFIARTRFVPIALLVHALVWLAILYMLHSIANGQTTYLGIAGHSAFAMAVAFPLVGMGAYFGQWVAARRGPRGPAAA